MNIYETREEISIPCNFTCLCGKSFNLTVKRMIEPESFMGNTLEEWFLLKLCPWCSPDKWKDVEACGINWSAYTDQKDAIEKLIKENAGR